MVVDKLSFLFQTEAMQIWRRVLLAGIVVVGFACVSLVNQPEAESLSNVSVTLSNSRLSFNGRLTSGNTVGTSHIVINTTAGAFPSTDSAQLVQGDTLAIGDTDSLANYTVTDVTSTSNINITPVLLSGDADSGDAVISSQSSTLTVHLTTKNAIKDGRFRILVPALADDTDSSDGLPDAGYFDFSSTTPTVTCPTTVANPSEYTFVTGTATRSAITTASGNQYHVFECAYSGTGAIGTAFDGSTNDAITISSLINPAPKSGHLTGTADTYKVIVQHLDSNLDVADTTSISIGAIEAVKVTASVEPQISFKITGVGTSGTHCGNTPNITTTAATIPLGSLSISGFTNGVQNLAVSTNAVNGYVVTAVENDQLGLNGAACSGDPWNPTANYSCIPDSRGDASTMTHTVSDEWSSTSVKGFAYSIEDINSTNAKPAFEYNNNSTCTDTSNGGTCTACDGTGDCFRQFADAADSQSVVRIFSSDGDTVADNDNVDVCYRAVIASTQAAGNYENYLTYTATATF